MNILYIFLRLALFCFLLYFIFNAVTFIVLLFLRFRVGQEIKKTNRSTARAVKPWSKGNVTDAEFKEIK